MPHKALSTEKERTHNKRHLEQGRSGDYTKTEKQKFKSNQNMKVPTMLSIKSFQL